LRRAPGWARQKKPRSVAVDSTTVVGGLSLCWVSSPITNELSVDQGSTLSVNKPPNPDLEATERAAYPSPLTAPSVYSPHRPAARRFRPESWRSPIRGPWLSSFLGTLLVPAIAVIAMTGFIGHWAWYPDVQGNGTFGPSLFHFPASWPSWSYAATQGTHVIVGLMALPLVLAKLWSVMPKLFQRPVIRNLAGALERISLLVLVASVLMEFATGVLLAEDFPSSSNFDVIHYYGAWVFGTLFVLHACIKLPVMRRAYRERGVLKPLMQSTAQTAPEPPDHGGLAPTRPADATISRRGLLALVGGASLAIFAVQAGESIGGPFRSLALLAPRGRVYGTGPNDFPVTHTAASAEISPAMTGADWRLIVVGARTFSLSRQQLLAMARSTRTLTITCTDGWSTTQHWTGVRLAELARLVQAPEGAIMSAISLEQAGPVNAKSRFPASLYTDDRSLLALRVNGVDLSLDHGYPARVIVPNVPGNLNTKWVSELRFEDA
jgi:DMSO/TMAO reductase YedYZ molybdopterin-dependent catalytic subunit